MKTIKNQTKEILDEEFLGHPSRKEQDDIDKLKRIVLLLAKEIDLNLFAIKDINDNQI